MYNEHQKERFLSEYTNESTAKKARIILKAISPLEEKWGAGVCTRSVKELEESLDLVVGVRTSSRFSAMTTLRKYCDWCVMNDVPGATRNIFEIGEVGIGKMESKLFGSPDHLQESLDSVFAPVSDGRTDNICRCFFWLAYMGVDSDDAPQVSEKDLDLKNNALRVGDKRIPLFKESIPVFRFLYAAKSFLQDYGHCEAASDRLPGNLLLRGLNNKKAAPNYTVIQQMAARKIRNAAISEDEKVKISFKNVYLSGAFFRIYQKEKATGEIDLSELTERHFKGSLDTPESRKVRVKKNYELDYDRWKRAFQLQ